jgi:hypothetical protein
VILQVNLLLRGRWNLGEGFFTDSNRRPATFLAGNHSLYPKEKRFFRVSERVFRMVDSYRQFKGLYSVCAGSVSAHRLQVAWNRPKKAKSPTALSQNMRGYGYSRFNRINNLGRLVRRKSAVRFGFHQILTGPRSSEGHPPYRKPGRTGRLPSPIHSYKMAGLSTALLRDLIVSLSTVSIFAFRKEGGAGGTC